MSTGLIALLDDVAGIAKVAAASLDDVAAAGRQGRRQGGRRGHRRRGGDAALRGGLRRGARAADRRRGSRCGSLKNKLLYLLPAALLLSFFAPWAITPLLMLGGAYLCYEGTEKVYRGALAAQAPMLTRRRSAPRPGPRRSRTRRCGGAIRTDFILSAEIMAITLASVPERSFWMQAVVLAAVGIGITALVYGGVALIVKADDAGVALARTARPVSGLADACAGARSRRRRPGRTGSSAPSSGRSGAASSSACRSSSRRSASSAPPR